MPEYDPNAEGDGRYVVAFIESAGEVSPVFERKLRTIAEEHLGSIGAEKWYLVEDLESMFEEVQEEIGSKTPKEGGIEGAKAVPWPDGVSSIGEALEFLQQAHREAYRDSQMKNPAGNYTFTRTGDREMQVGVTNGFYLPTAWAKGVFEYVPREFGPNDTHVRLTEKSPEDHQIASWELLW
jgi:hypothetical protein